MNLTVQLILSLCITIFDTQFDTCAVRVDGTLTELAVRQSVGQSHYCRVLEFKVIIPLGQLMMTTPADFSGHSWSKAFGAESENGSDFSLFLLKEYESVNRSMSLANQCAKFWRECGEYFDWLMDGQCTLHSHNSSIQSCVSRYTGKSVPSNESLCGKCKLEQKLWTHCSLTRIHQSIWHVTSYLKVRISC